MKTGKILLRIFSMMIVIGTINIYAVSWSGIAVTKAHAATATIGGGIFSGSQNPDGTPNTTTAVPLSDAHVMVQDGGGGFVAYGTVSGNTWSATVPSPGKYLVMFSAPGHDATSREFEVIGGNVMKDAYLPPLPLPLANLLVYAFQDNYVNGEDDFPDDPGLAGVTFTVYDEKGNQLATGISGASPTLPPLAGPDANGLYYFTGLPSGEVKVCADPSTSPSTTTGWYLTTTEEGSHCWETVLYPGDPGTEAGLYRVWFGYVSKLGQIASPTTDSTSITGALKDADGNWFVDEPLTNLPPGVTPNDYVPNGLAILFTNGENTPVRPVATAEADPSGNFQFDNVPPGRYKIHAVDVPLNYVYVQQEVSVTPNTPVTGLDIFVPRFYGRANGHVMDTAGNPISGAKVNLRLESGSIWKETTTDTTGWYNFDTLEEVEITGHLDVTLPPGYHGLIEPIDATLPGKAFNLMSRDILWFTMNYRADLTLEAIPAGGGDIAGMVYYDHLEPALGWTGNGVYEPDEERTIHGATVELYDATGTTLLVTTTTGQFSEADALAQGWIKPYTCNAAFNPAYGFVLCNLDEFGRVIKGPVPGYYEFRGLAPGDYMVKVIPPAGFSASPAGSDLAVVTVADGARNDHNVGLNTLAPLAGEVEGGVFDDINLDEEPLSLLFQEKAGVPGVPVGIYDHLGYFLGAGWMGNPLCYEGSTVCPGGGPLGQKPEVEVRTAPGVHIYRGNDPTLPGYNPCYAPLDMNYEFAQGGNKFEADWSLLPLCFTDLAGAQGGGGNIQPLNAPVIGGGVAVNDAAPFAINNFAKLILSDQYPWMRNKSDRFKSSTLPVLAFNNAASLTLNDGGPITIPNADPARVDLRVVMLSTTTVSPGSIFHVTGSNFGDRQGYSTATLSGQRLLVTYWSDTRIDVFIPLKAISGSIIVATSTGISNALPIRIVYNSIQAGYMNARSVFVDAGAASGGNGSMSSPYKTITEALNHLPASTPRYVFVKPGTYPERIRIKESDVNIIGAGPQETIIDGRPSYSSIKVDGGPVIFIGRGGMTGSVRNVAISGFTIRGGTIKDEIGAGIFGDYGNQMVDINNCIITRNGGYYGGGIWLHKSNHTVSIWSNTIAENGNTGGYGGGISVNDEPGYGVADHEPDHTLDDSNPGPPPGEYNIFNNLIFHNYSPDYGGGISLYEIKDKLNVFGNMLLENRSDDHGGGMFLEDTGPADINGNVFLRNYAGDDGGAISFEDVGDYISVIGIYNNLFAENIADDHGENVARGGALSFDDTFYAAVYNNTIVGNIVAGSYTPAGGGIDSERNGHEYLTKTPGYSDPKIYNNIIQGNYRLQYDQPKHRNLKEEDKDYTWGIHYRWTPDNLHVDNPAKQAEYQSANNSESFTFVQYNDITGGYSSGVKNIDVNPLFVNPPGLNWHLRPGSPVENKAPYSSAAKIDLDRLLRIPALINRSLWVEMGAYDIRSPQPEVVRIPTGILGAIKLPPVGSTKMP
ncbi:MAG: hypothetical protein HY204_04845 [Nitrospirae bacterium]|nr:hypothetical protein [Nitrospirota bacterium]